MKEPPLQSYRARYAAFLLRWAQFSPALPKYYAALAQDRLRQKGHYGITDQQLYSLKNDGNMPDNPAIVDVLEELAKQYHPDKIRSEKDARKFLRTWEPRPGRKVQAALQAAA
ncbi:hypothetical protein [Hymenobacter fodinae]|uniref:J domain-containing protein n=1 Tax=Hymenobacter fodinae TaxID=2510796 RepID=A0A4Z0P2Y7_9BACT|nr:hypothetical protein [Hymenobacter fodinae]TGE05611.1 hypothetical protein EU556_20125 [Hymenobacter fodinae]